MNDLINKKIRTHIQIEQRDYVNSAQIARLRFAGQIGIIIDSHNSHGLCYDIQFLGGIATYDSDEFTLL